MEDYGGLIKYMPQTALFFLIGSMAISALPPFNGFFSEWLTFQSLFQGIALLNSSARWIFIISAGALAFTGGLALACFVKVFGATFLARPRSQNVLDAKEASVSLRIGMGFLAVLSLLFGLFSGFVVSFINKIGNDLDIFHNVTSFISVSSNQGLNTGNFSFVSAPTILIFMVISIALILFLIKYLVYKQQKVKLGTTWDCGTGLAPRMEITATGFAYSIITIFQGVLKPSIQHEVEYSDVDSRYLPKSRTVTLGVKDVYRTYFYKPLSDFVGALSEKVKSIQSGNINIYILYIFIALLIALVSVK
jgi:hydrogenase-4 component B